MKPTPFESKKVIKATVYVRVCMCACVCVCCVCVLCVCVLCVCVCEYVHLYSLTWQCGCGFEHPITLPLFSNTCTHRYFCPSSATWFAHSSIIFLTSSRVIRGRTRSERGWKHITRLEREREKGGRGESEKNDKCKLRYHVPRAGSICRSGWPSLPRLSVNYITC